MSIQVNIGWAYNDPNNNKYYLTVAASITQMLTKSNPDNFYNIYIITDRNDDFNIIKYLYKGNNYKITKSEPKGSEYLKGYEKIQLKEKKWTHAALWGLLFQYTFPEVDTMIYCEGDILFNGDIAKLWEDSKDEIKKYHILGNRSLQTLVLHEHSDNVFWKQQYDIMLNYNQNYEQLKDKMYEKWINGGFFICNLKMIREDKCDEEYAKTIEYITSTPNCGSSATEEILFLNEKMKINFLDFKWNFFVFNSFSPCQYYWITHDIDKVKDVCKNALTFHYGDPKPWNYNEQLNTPGMFKREVLGVNIDFTIYNHEVFKDYKKIYDNLTAFSIL